MSDPHVRRYMTAAPTDPHYWRACCCAPLDPEDTYDVEADAVRALVDHLEVEHRMTVRAVTVLDLMPYAIGRLSWDATECDDDPGWTAVNHRVGHLISVAGGEPTNKETTDD